MKTRLVVCALLSLGTMSDPLLAKTKANSEDPRPPRIETISSATGVPEALLIAVAVQPVIPRGPNDLAREYEVDMDAVSGQFTGGLEAISQAAGSGEITSEQAEQISKERYQVAMMQFQLLFALHANLERDIERTQRTAPTNSYPKREVVTAVVELPFSSLQLSGELTQYLGLTPNQAAAIQEVMADERGNFEPMMAELRATGQKLYQANQKGQSDREVHALAMSQATILSNLIVANSRMQSRIYGIVDKQQRKKLDHLRQANEVSVIAEQ